MKVKVTGYFYKRMRSASFHFKRFSVFQRVSSHKVGTDGVLLGAWAGTSATDSRMLDIGTGTGLIALMLAQRTPPKTQIDAIDIGRPEVQEARKNIACSPWPQKITVYEGAVQHFDPGYAYNLVVSNPPYFVNSLIPPDQRRRTSRHTGELPFGELLAAVLRLLAPKGRFAAIFPYREGLQFLKMSAAQGMHPVRSATFRTRTNKPPERLLIELSRSAGPATAGDIVLYSEGQEWSEDYRRLMHDFYLKA